MSQAKCEFIAVVRYPDDYDSMEGGGKMTSVHALCAVERNGRRIPFVINPLNSSSVLDGTLNETWRQSVQKAGIDPVVAIRAAQELGHVLNHPTKLASLPEIASVLHAHCPGENMPVLRTPFVALANV